MGFWRRRSATPRRLRAIAAIGTSLPSATQVDLSTTAVQLMQEKANIGMNTAILKSTLDSERRVLDILA